VRRIRSDVTVLLRPFRRAGNREQGETQVVS
jgi:hypothetical protein